MQIQIQLEAFFLTLVSTYIVFMAYFYYVTSRKKSSGNFRGEEEEKGMASDEKKWLAFLIIVAIAANAITLAPIIPSIQYNVYAQQAPAKTVKITVKDYEFHLPENPIRIKAGQLVVFVVTSEDVTYGFGVFRKDGTMVFQMQVVPGYENRIKWVFDEPGVYSIRSTEYSGPEHPKMFLPDVIVVEG